VSGKPIATCSLGLDAGERAEDRVAKPRRLGLHDIGDAGRSDPGAVVVHDVALAGRDDEAELVDAGLDHPLDQMLAYGAWPFDAVLKPAADRQQLLGEGQRLDAAADPGRWNDAPHGQASV
jgi:hypothetical protein